jgi:hypothetical protein
LFGSARKTSAKALEKSKKLDHRIYGKERRSGKEKRRNRRKNSRELKRKYCKLGNIGVKYPLFQ